MAPPIDLRQVDYGCMICGLVPTDPTTRRELERVLFGLPPAPKWAPGPHRHMIVGELCAACVDSYRTGQAISEQHYPAGGGPSFLISATLLDRWRSTDPKRAARYVDGFPTWETVRKQTWAGHVLTEREADRDDPDLPAVPFGWVR